MEEPVPTVANDTPEWAPITVNIVRTVRVGQEEAFEGLVRRFIPVALAFPGHLGVHVVKPAARNSRDYHVVIKFATTAQWRSFRDWPQYVQFRTEIEPLLEREPCVHEMVGLESWFTLPDAPALRPLPKWKMALVTLLAVYPTSLLITTLLRPRVAHWPLALQNLLFTTTMVGLLTWLVMPLLTRLLSPWLYARADSEDEPPRT